MTGEVTREEMIAWLRRYIATAEPYAHGDTIVAADVAVAKAILRELEAGGWRPRADAPDTDDPILGYSPIPGDPAEDEQAGHYAITSGSFLLCGGWAACTLWRPITPPGTSDGGGE